jgi:hypothetical protein
MRANEVIKLAHALAAVAQQAPVRILLLTRSTRHERGEAEWWRSLRTPSNPLQAAFLEAEQYTLPPLPADKAGVGARKAIFRSARERFASLLRISVTTAEPNLAEPMYDTYLFLQIAALVALTTRGGFPSGEADLLDAVLAAERDLIWRPTARAHRVGADQGPTDTELDTSVAAATLAVADSRDTAINLLRLIPDVAATGSVTRIADWLRGLYPGTGWLRPLRPDRLGDHHVATVVRDHPTLPQVLLDHALARLEAADEDEAAGEPARSANRTMTVLARAATYREYEAAATALRQTLSRPGHAGRPLLHRLVELVAQPRDQSPLIMAPLAAGLTAALGVVHLPDVAAAALENSFPYLFDDLAYTLQMQRLEHLRQQAQTNPARRPDLVHALGDTYLAQLKAGHETDANEKVLESLSLARALYDEDPDTYGSLLAMVLYLATMAFGEREPERAVEYAESASALCEALNRRNEYQHSVLKHALDAHAWALSYAGRQEEAIQKFREEVARLDELALFEADPDAELDAHIQASGAVATLAHHLAIAGQADYAVAHAHEAVERAQQLRASNPDDPGTLLGLMAAWNGFAGVMLEVNRPGEAIEPAQAALAICRRLEAMQPGDFAPSVSTSLERLAITLVDAGRPDEAIEPLNEAVTIQRAVAEGSPALGRRMLASALGHLSNALTQAGRANEAALAAQEAIDIYDQLLSERIGDPTQARQAREILAKQIRPGHQ